MLGAADVVLDLRGRDEGSEDLEGLSDEAEVETRLRCALDAVGFESELRGRCALDADTGFDAVRDEFPDRLSSLLPWLAPLARNEAVGDAREDLRDRRESCASASDGLLADLGAAGEGDFGIS